MAVAFCSARWAKLNVASGYTVYLIVTLANLNQFYNFCIILIGNK